MKKFKFYQFVLALVAAVLISAGAAQINTASAAPVASAHNFQGVVGEQATDVQWRRRHRGRYVGPAIALGIFGAAAAAAAAQNQQYYYSQPRQKCWVQTGPYQGQGYWSWC
ncbi:MAG: hypothetical protein KF807_12500 [Xanthobacteraceae bacterium]|nr:hypothetical protein [Xanthobacteraceae bacterium]